MLLALFQSSHLGGLRLERLAGLVGLRGVDLGGLHLLAALARGSGRGQRVGARHFALGGLLGVELRRDGVRLVFLGLRGLASLVSLLFDEKWVEDGGRRGGGGVGVRKKEEEFFSSEKSARQRRNVFGVKISPTPPLLFALSRVRERLLPIGKQKNAKQVLTPPLTFFASSLATFSANFAVFLGVCLTAAASPATASPSPFDFFA